MDHRVTCVNTTPSGTHHHITHLGLGNGSTYYRRITVAEVIQNLRNPLGDRYHTISPMTGDRKSVV